MRFILFFVVVLVVLTVLGVYVHRRAADLLRLARPGRRVLGGVLIAGVVAMFSARLARALLPTTVLRALGTAGSVLSLAVILSACLLAVIDVAGILGRLVARLAGARPAAAVDLGIAAAAPAATGAVAASTAVASAAPGVEAPAVEAPGVEAPAVPRRSFLAQGAAGSAFLIGGSSSVYGALVGRHDYVIEETPIRIPGLARGLDGFTIVQISDIHLGLFVGEPEMRAAEELVRKARPDLLVLTGDLVDFDPAYAEMLGRFVRRLQPYAREPVAVIPGNHDHFTGIEATMGAAERAGAQVLRNRGRVVGGAGGAFSLVGVDDVWAARMHLPGGGPDLRRALADVPPDLPRVLLCHNPEFFPEAAGEVALQLSGHTHGGQVNLLVRPADLILPFGYVAGLYRRGNAQLYVNRGFGTAGPPVRLGSAPEVSRIVLVSA